MLLPVKTIHVKDFRVGRFWRERGQSVTEYAMMSAMLFVMLGLARWIGASAYLLFTRIAAFIH